MNNYSTTLFSQIVSTIGSINMNIDCGTYDQLADALNMQGFIIPRGKLFTGATLQSISIEDTLKVTQKYSLKSLKNFMMNTFQIG